jgi:hypothetical protein
MSELPPAQFRKTKSGKWAVMAPVESLEAALSADGRLDVLKKSGDWGKFTVASVGKPFDVDGVPMCYGYGPGDEDPNGGPGRGGARTQSRPDRTNAAPAPAEEPPPSDATWANAPSPDESEPVPEYQGGPEDEWQEF